MGDTEDTIWRIDRFVQSINVLGLDIAEATAQEQGCDPGSDFAFLDLQNHTSYATHYYRQKLESCRHMTDFQDPQFRNKIKHFVASKADLIFKLKGKEKLHSGIDYNIDGAQEAYSVFATQVLPIENGMQLSSVARRAQIFEILKVGDIILGKVVGKRPFGVFVRILSLVHGRNLDFNNIDIQALCPKSELEKDHKSREHLDPIDDFDVDDIVQGVICSISTDEERIAISFRSAKLPSEYGNIELGIIEDIEEDKLRPKSFDDDLDYNEYLRRDPGFSNPSNIQTLIDVLGIDSRPPNSLLRSCQRWTFSDKEADSLRKQQSKNWSMDTTAIGVESFKNGDHEKALKYLNHALKIYEENSEALVARGALYANQNKLEDAIKDFKKALKLHPKHYNASKYLKETLFEKGLRLKDVGNTREAINIFEEVLELDPDSIESQENLKELKSLLSAKLVEEENKARMAASLLQENRKKFEHVRKLIKSDPAVVKSSRKKKRKKKKAKKMKSKKRRRRSESETTSTASEAERYGSDGNQWIEKDLKKPSPTENKNVVSGLREAVEAEAMQSNISAETSECTSQSNLLQKVSTFAKEGRFEKSCPVSKVDTASDALDQNLDNNGSAAMAAGVCSDTRGSYVASERRFSEMSESRIDERNLGGVVEEVGEREGGEGEMEREAGDKATEDIRERMGNVNNENINISGANIRECSRRHSSRSRSRSESHEKKDGALTRRSNARDLNTHKESGKNLNESDTDSGEYQGKGRERRSRNRHVRRRTRSSSDNSSHERTRKRRYRKNVQRKGSKNIRDTSSDSSARNRTRSRSNSLKRDRSRIIRGRRSVSKGSRGRRSTSRDSRGRRRSSRDSSEGDRSRSRSNSSKRDKSRIIRGRKGTNEGSRGWRSTSRRSTSRSGSNGRNQSRSTSKSLERDRSRRGRRSTSMDNKERRSTSSGRRRRRSTSRSSKGRRRTSRGNRGRRSTSMDNRGRRSVSRGRRRLQS